MKIQIDSRTYQIPREYELEVFDQLWNREALPWYDKVEKWARVAVMPFTRIGLAFLEKQTEKEAGPEKAKLIRPPERNTDPNLWLGEVLAKMLLEGLKYVTLVATTNENGELSNFHLELEASGGSQASPVVTESQGQAGGQLGPGRDEGKW